MEKETPEAGEKGPHGAYNVGKYYHDKPEPTLSPARLKFAKQILLGLAILVGVIVVASAALATLPLWGLFPDDIDNTYLAGFAERLLDITQMTIPPIATLVLGYYFGNKS